MYANRYGRFVDDGRGFQIDDWRTPMPWVNVICNGRYGVVLSQAGGGFSWLDHCQLNVVTRWEMDLARDDRGRFVYVRDLDVDVSGGADEARALWSLAPQPCRVAYDSFNCTHRPGATTYASSYAGIEASWTITVDKDETGEVWAIELRNTSDRPRRLRVASFHEWCCGAAPDIKREFHRLFFTTTHDADRRAIVATKNMWEAPFGNADDHWNRPWPHAAAISVDGLDTTIATADKRDFYGRVFDDARPQAMLREDVKPGSFGRFGDASAALGGDIELAPGETKTIAYSIAVADTPDAAAALASSLASVDRARSIVDAACGSWDERLGTTNVESGRGELDLLINTWLPYQAISGRLWGRTGYYQQSGAFGYRDQLQDSQVWLPIEPARCRAQILHHAAHQFADGTVYHWWNPITETGNRTACSDDYLWLPFVTAAYVRDTGDLSITEAKARFVDDETEATLAEHCRRAIAKLLARRTARGLPLIGDMDWNDGLSAMGDEERSESIWLAMFGGEVLARWAEVERRTGNADAAERYEAERDALFAAVNEHAWDGAWFRRATDKRGRWLGASESEAGQIFLNPQSWAILTGAAGEERLDAAWASVKERLLTAYGPLLLAPAYTEPDPEVGYITRYAPGARENGGVYMHAAIWALAAACKRKDVDAATQIWESIAPPVRCEDADAYHAEPYVLPGNVDGPLSDLPGRAGWTWYTGSAAWLHRVTLEWILGVRPEWDGLRIDPCPVRGLGTVRVRRLWRGRTVNIAFDASGYADGATPRLTVDGEAMSGNLLRESMLAEGGETDVRIGWVAGGADEGTARPGLPDTEVEALPGVGAGTQRASGRGSR